MDVVVRSLVVYVLMWLLLRALGKRELGEITAFELLLLVVTGDLVQQGITGEDYSVVGSLLPVATISLFILATSYLSFRSSRTREALEGLPAVVVRRGRFVDEVIRLERVTHDEILDAARAKGIGDLATVEVGILEADGKFSFVLASVPAPLPDQ